MSLPVHSIGNDKLPYPGFGAMGLSGFGYSTRGKTDDDMLPVLKEAYDMGCRLWDTADIYSRPRGMHDNESLVAKAVKAYDIPRKTTKFGCKPNTGGGMDIVGDPAYVKAALEASLDALSTNYLDLYYQHRVDPNVPMEDTVKAMKELQEAGKIRYIGLSECSAATLRRAAKFAKIHAYLSRGLGITVVAYSPLGRGMLSGKIRTREDLPADDGRCYLPRFSEESFPKNVALSDQISNLAAKKTSGQLALAWLHAQWDHVIAIPVTTRIKALNENIASARVTLTEEELAEVLAHFDVAGDRCCAPFLAQVNI